MIALLLSASLMLVQLSPPTPGEAQRSPDGSQCGLIRNSDDQWFCIALEQRNCALAPTSSGYWRCEALLQKKCTLNMRSDDYWFCESLLQRSCGLNLRSDDMWMCRGILESNCGLSAKTDDFWFCEAMKGPLNRILAPPEKPPKPAEPERFIL